MRIALRGMIQMLEAINENSHQLVFLLKKKKSLESQKKRKDKGKGILAIHAVDRGPHPSFQKGKDR